ncbi:MAG: hypothetical protein QG640_511 [Patescibacteria group bacterium]|nr:hypothetical protein [Patescibacteria group bacterium]
MSKRKKDGKSNGNALLHDVVMIAFGIAIAIILSKTGAIDFAVSAFKDYYIIASFFAGIFFTSAFTLAPASIALVHIAENSPIHGVALWGGLGAMCGDLILFFFIRDRFAEDLMKAVRPSTVKRILKSLHFGFLRWLSPLLGALIIASPLPDEFGITLLGMSKVRLAVLIPIALTMNILGIYLLIEFSHLL